MLPFLKDRHEGGMSGSIDEKITRKSDDGDDSLDMMDAIVDDMIDAVHKKDKSLLRGALEALVEHIQGQDQIQDFEDME